MLVDIFLRNAWALWQQRRQLHFEIMLYWSIRKRNTAHSTEALPFGIVMTACDAIRANILQGMLLYARNGGCLGVMECNHRFVALRKRWLRRGLNLQFAKQNCNRLLAPLWRVREINFRPASHICRQQRI